MSITDLTPASLRRAAQIKEQIDTLTSELSSILGDAVSLNPQPLPPKTGKRQMSAAGRARIAAAARARWAKYNAAKGAPSKNSALSTRHSPLKAGRRKMSPAARAKIAAAAKARWAKAKAAGKSRL